MGRREIIKIHFVSDKTKDGREGSVVGNDEEN